jgi:hypothetical protein
MSAAYIDPVFVMIYPQNPPIDDYRCVVNASGTAVIFERWVNPVPGNQNPPFVLYQLDLTVNGATPAPFLRGTATAAFMTSTRPDWSWNAGQVAFCNSEGIWIVGDEGINSALLGKTGE